MLLIVKDRDSNDIKELKRIKNVFTQTIINLLPRSKHKL